MPLQERGAAYYFVGGLAIGLAAGGLLGLLYAPQTGRKTRRQIAAAVKDGADLVASKAEDAADYLQKQTSYLRDEAGELLDGGRAVIEDGRDRISSAFMRERNSIGVLRIKSSGLYFCYWDRAPLTGLLFSGRSSATANCDDAIIFGTSVDGLRLSAASATIASGRQLGWEP